MKCVLLLLLMVLIAISCNSYNATQFQFANKLEDLCYSSGEYCVTKWKQCYTHCAVGEEWLESGRRNASCQRYNTLKMMQPDIGICEYMVGRSLLEAEQYYRKYR